MKDVLIKNVDIELLREQLDQLCRIDGVDEGVLELLSAIIAGSSTEEV